MRRRPRRWTAYLRTMRDDLVQLALLHGSPVTLRHPSASTAARN
jgi:hypothetical protein